MTNDPAKQTTTSLEEEAKRVILKEIVRSADESSKGTRPNVKLLAEAYALVMGFGLIRGEALPGKSASS